MMHKYVSNRWSGWASMAMLFFLVLQSAPGCANDNDHPVAIVVTTETPIEANGLRVYRDPISGRLGPPPVGISPPGLSIVEQRRLNRSDRGLRARSLPNGAVAIDLQGRFMSMAVATTDAGGQPAVNCTLTPTEANAVLQSAVRSKMIER